MTLKKSKNYEAFVSIFKWFTDQGFSGNYSYVKALEAVGAPYA